jgi:YEATS family
MHISASHSNHIVKSFIEHFSKAMYCTQNGESRIRGGEVVCPIVMGTVAWYLGKKVRKLLRRLHTELCAWRVCLASCGGSQLMLRICSQASETMTHKWTVYVRGARGQDLSYCIKKVEVHLKLANPAYKPGYLPQSGSRPK